MDHESGSVVVRRELGEASHAFNAEPGPTGAFEKDEGTWLEIVYGMSCAV